MKWNEKKSWKQTERIQRKKWKQLVNATKKKIKLSHILSKAIANLADVNTDIVILGHVDEVIENWIQTYSEDKNLIIDIIKALYTPTHIHTHPVLG